MRRVVLLGLALISLALVSADKAADKGKAQRHEVSIRKLQYSPQSLKIKAGDTVVWTNNDDRDHTVTAKDGSFKSDNLKSGETFEHTFSKAGKFAYGCTYHPRMKGEIVVE